MHDYKELVKLGITLLHKERADRAKAIKQGKAVKGGNNPILNVRLLGLRVGNLRDERALAKTKKLDGVRPAFLLLVPLGLEHRARD